MEISINELNERIAKSGRKKKWIAKKLEIPYGTLSAYLTGIRNIPNHINNKIIDLLRQ